MTEAVEAGWPKLEIEAAAARRQARIDRGEDVIVGVNKFRREDEPPIEVRAIDNAQVRDRPDRQARKAESLARRRKVSAALDSPEERRAGRRQSSGAGDRSGARPRHGG